MPRKTISQYKTEARNRHKLIEHLHSEVSRLGKEVDEAKKQSEGWRHRHNTVQVEIGWFKLIVEKLVLGRNPNALPR